MWCSSSLTNYKDTMFYLIYKITNKLNNNIYIGFHQTKNKDDGYMGSGKYIRHAIKKYGVENFSKEILFELNSAEEMHKKEAELVNENFLAQTNTYNLRLGGTGGFDYINKNKLYGFSNQEVAKAGRSSANKKLEEKYGKEWHSIISKKGQEKSSEAVKVLMETNPEFSKEAKDRANNASKCALSDDARKKRKQTFEDIGHQVGNKNSQFGKMWITNGIESKSILKNKPIPNGWYKGRKIS